MKTMSKRILSLLLVALLVMGCFPITAFASGGGGSEGKGTPITGGGSDTGWNFPGYYDGEGGDFTRFTLVEFPEGIEEGNWLNFNVLGSVDVCKYGQDTDNVVAIKTKDYNAPGNDNWRGMDALTYRAKLHDAGDAQKRLEILQPYVWYRLFSDEMTETRKWTPVNQNQVIGSKFLIKGDAYSMYKLAKTLPAGQNPLLRLFGQRYDGTGDILETGWTQGFHNLLVFLGLSEGTDGFVETGTKTYRVLAEPGMICDPQNSSGIKYALTVRDMAALEAYNAACVGKNLQDWAKSGTEGARTLSWALSRGLMQRLGWPLYEKYDNFTAINNEKTGLAPKSSPAAFGGYKNKDLEWFVANERPRLQARNAFEAVLGMGTQNDTGYGNAEWATDEYASYGLGILLPDMVPTEPHPITPTITVRKTVTGDATEADRAQKWDMTLNYFQLGADESQPSSAIPGTVTAVDGAGNTVAITNDGPIKPEWTESGLCMGLSFSLADGESLTFTFNTDEETIKKGFSYRLQETLPESRAPRVVTSYVREGIESIVAEDGGLYGNTNIFPTSDIEVKNTVAAPTQEKAHLIIDYNFNGAPATTGGGNPSSDAVMDCGALFYEETTDETKNWVYDLKPSMEGVALTVGKTYTESVPCTKCGGTSTLTMTYKGLFDAPTGGNALGDKYRLQHGGLTVLYCQWDKSITTTCTCGGDSGGGGLEPASNLYTVFWDWNYNDAAVTSSIAGYFTFWKRLDKCTLTCSGESHGHTFPNDKDFTQVTVDFPFSVPDSQKGYTPTRSGWEFIGWSTKKDAGNGVYGAAALALKDSAEIKLIPDAPGEATTFYAIWKANDIRWDANGGYFDLNIETEWPEGSEWAYSEGNTIGTWTGWINNQDAVPIIKRNPSREGYTFDKWYYDRLGNVPIDETEYGLIPGRTYYAGWTPQPVKVNYYDNRQGTGLVTTQTYNYNDKFSLLNDLTSTDGQTFTGWKVLGSGANAASSGTRLVNGTMDMAFVDAESRPVDDKDGGYWEINLVASWNEETVDYTSTIVWDDTKNNDGLRPQAVHVGVVSSVGNQLVADEWVTGGSSTDSWSTTFSALPVTTADASVEKITYRTAVLGYKDHSGKVQTIADTAATEKVILADLTDSATDANAPTYKYSLDNISRPDGDTTNRWFNAYNGTVTMAHELVTINYPFHIFWQDDYDNDGYRPLSVGLNLYQNGSLMYQNPYHAAEVDCETRDHGAQWSYYFPNLLKYYNEGQLIDYSVSVVSLAEINSQVPTNSSPYTMAYTNGATGPDRHGVTFARTTDTANYTGNIVWADDNNRDGRRPDSVAVNLVGECYNQFTDTWETKTIDTIPVTGGSRDNVWNMVFNNEPVFSGGKKIVYSIALGELNAMIPEGSPLYTWEYTDARTRTATVTRPFDTTSVEAMVSWSDENNKENFRPQEILVRLYADGVKMEGDSYVAKVQGGSDNTWTCTFDGLIKNRAGGTGTPIVYSIVAEELNEGDIYGNYASTTGTAPKYAAVYRDKDGQNTSDATKSALPYVSLVHNTQVKNVPGKIVWADTQNQDGVRPETVAVNLTARVWNRTTNAWDTQVVATENVSGGKSVNEWPFTFENMPVYTEGAEVVYSLTLGDLNAGLTDKDNPYTWEVTEPMTATATHVLNTTTVEAMVNWTDNNDNEHFRPQEILVRLYADGVKMEGDLYLAKVQGGSSNTWTHTFANLPKTRTGKVGEPIVYSIKAEEINDGDLYGSYASTSGTVPKYVAIYQDKDGNNTKDVTKSVLPYVSLVHENQVKNLPGKIIWNDAQNRDGIRPETVAVYLNAAEWNRATNAWETRVVEVMDVTGDRTANEWAFTFENMPVYAGGAEVVYSITLGDLNSMLTTGDNPYTWEITDTMTATASHVLNTTSVEAMVSWSDNDNNEHFRPQEILVRLYADGVKMDGDLYLAKVKGGENNTWTHTFINLPKNRVGGVGAPIVYSIDAEEVNKDDIYGTVISMATGEQQVVKKYTAYYYDANEQNTEDVTKSVLPYVQLVHGAQVCTVNVYASWHDDNNKDGKRPESLLVDLYKEVAGKSFLVDTMTVSAGEDGSWTYHRPDLPLYENGSLVRYYVEVSDDFRSELQSRYGYTVSLQDNVVHLFYKAEKGSVTATVNWADNNNNDGLRPENLSATLYANGEEISDSALLMSAENNWTVTWYNRPAYFADKDGEGQSVKYSVVVNTDNTAYVASYTPASVSVLDGQDIVVTMAHEGDMAPVSGNIYWNDANDQDAVRPTSVQVQLYADGQAVPGATRTVTGEGNTWTMDFGAMPVLKEGAPIYYTIGLNDNTGATYEHMTTGTDLYLSYKPVKATMYVSFQFDDRANADGKRPSGLYLHLTADGKKVEEAEYVHTVSFDTLVDGSRWTFGSLPVYSVQGKKIDYQVEVSFDNELFGGEGYTATPSKSIQLSDNGGALNQVVVVLRRDADVTVQGGSVYWFDNDNQRGNRPTKLTISVHNNNTSRIDGPYTMDASTMTITDAKSKEVGKVTGITEWGDIDDSRWDYEIYGLPKNTVYEDGTAAEITYWATANMSGLSNWYSKLDGQDTGMDITMTHKLYEQDQPSSSQNYDLSVVWADNSNAWGYRPESAGVDVVMLANGAETKYRAHLNSDNATEETPNVWSYQIQNLPTYLNGHAVVWTAQISDHNKYMATETAHGTYSVIKMAQVGSYDLSAIWNDAQDNDNKRPDSITVEVLADGATVDTITMTGEGDTWTTKVEDLPVWRENGSNLPVSYSFRWSNDTAMALSGLYSVQTATSGGEWGKTDNTDMRDLSATWTATLTHNKETMATDFTVPVTFDDDANRDGTRPETVYVTLMANGQPMGDPKAVSGDKTEGTWTATWSNLYVYNNGTPITYTVRMDGVYDGYTTDVDASGTQITLTHAPAKVAVTAKVNWFDNSELHYKGDSLNETYASIPRVDTYLQLVANGEPVDGAIKKILAADYTMENGKVAGYAQWTWDGLYQKENGQDIVYTFTVTSPELDLLLADGYGRRYNNSTPYKPEATISHDLYDVRGTVYFLRDTDNSFRLGDVPVTAYLYNKADNTYTAVGSARTNANGEFEILNLPQGLLTIRATYTYTGVEYAGSAPVNLDRMDNTVRVMVDRDSTPDSDLYLYTAVGHAYYQTSSLDTEAIYPVPEGSIVLLYRMLNGSEQSVEYLDMAQTDATGGYQFNGLTRGKYLVNVVFNYDGGTYTIDNEDIKGLTFTVTGADARWPDLVKQVVAQTPVNPDDPDTPDVPSPEPEQPEPCVVFGSVYYSENGSHTTNPVEGVNVYLYTAESNVKIGQTKTDKAGAWSIEGVPAGDYIVVLSLNGVASRVVAITVAEDDYDNGEIEVSPQYFERNTESATATIRGGVLTAEGKKENALVKVLDENGTVVDFGYVDQNGQYAFSVAAGKTYRTQIVRVEPKETSVVVGMPGTGLSTLDHYDVGGNYAIGGKAQVGQTIAVYQQQSDMSYKLVTATLTDAQGHFALKVAEDGNYKVVYYKDREIYAERQTTIGLPGTVPTVTQAGETYTITGTDRYDSLTLYAIENGVTRIIKTQLSGTGYTLTGLPKGSYDLALTSNGKETHYYVDCPDNTLTKTYHMTISGSVLDQSNAPILGATVKLLDQNGKQVGKETIITDGSYAYTELPAGTYTVKTTYPVMGDMMADKTTKDPDSYGLSYANGIEGGATWTWNINTVALSGTVTDQYGTPVQGATIVVKNERDPNLAYGAMSDKDGKWTVGVMPGNYTVDAMVEIDESHIYHDNAHRSVAAQKPVSDIGLVIERATLTVNVTKAGDGTALADMPVSVTYASNNVPVAESKTNKDGSVTFTVYPDSYIVTANSGDAKQAVKVSKDMTVDMTVDIPVTLTGIVYAADHAPMDDAIVHYEGAKTGTAYTDKDGRYTVALSASELGTYTMWAEAQGMTSEKVAVQVQGDTVQDLTMPKAASQYKISGVVTDNKGNRLENAVITALYGNDKEKTMQTSTNRNGEYSFAVDNGTYYLTATYGEYRTNGETAVLINGSSQVKNLPITLSHPVTITVKDTDGNPASGAVVTYMGPVSGSVEVSNEGVVIIDLPGGDYTFSAIIGNRESEDVDETVNGKTSVALTVDSLGLVVKNPTIEPSGTMALDGVVKDHDGDPVANAAVVLERYDFDAERWVKVADTTSDTLGNYHFGGLTEGRYQVSIQYTAVTETNGQPSGYVITDVAADENGNPYVGAKVSLINEAGKTVQSVKTSEDGSYTFANLKAGIYTVTITTTDGVSVMELPGVEAKPTTVAVVGTALDADGNAVSSATVTVTDKHGMTWTGTTDEDGNYRFDLPGNGPFTVSITYPKTILVETETYPVDSNPGLTADTYNISGMVEDTDGNALDGVNIVLRGENGVVAQTTAINGKYSLTGIPGGEYTLEATWNGQTKSLTINTDGSITPVDPDVPMKPLTLSGMVVTDHKIPLVGATVTVENVETGDMETLTTDAEGRFSIKDRPVGQYELVAGYAHKYGENTSDAIRVAKSHDDIALVIVLSYTKDVNGDGENEIVYTGEDGAFDTEDDFYQNELPGQGAMDNIYAGKDKALGTPDDYYARDLDNDGTKETIYVGPDTIPGTSDDWYAVDVDDNGTDDPVYAGNDGIPGTPDDWFNRDVDGDGKPDKVIVGPDGKPNTADDKTEGGASVLMVWFDANGGQVGGKDRLNLNIGNIKALPTATKDRSSFTGWFTSTKDDAETVTLENMAKLFRDGATTFYAHWRPIGGGTSGGGSHSGGGSAGGGGGNGGSVSGTVTVKFDTAGGLAIPDQTIARGSCAKDPGAPVKYGFRFLGWDKAFDFAKPIYYNVTLTARWEYAGVAGFLTKDHIAYIMGKGDGLVHPEANITRAEVAMIFYRLLNAETRTAYQTTDHSYTDVVKDAWYETAVATLSRMGIVRGKGNNTFDPNGVITRAEFAAMATRFDKLESGSITFLDVPETHWAYAEIASAATRGWVKGYGNGNFGPADLITRAEAMTMTNRVLDRDAITLDSILAEDMVQWTDNTDTTSWYYLAVQEATNAHTSTTMDGIETWTAVQDPKVSNK